MIADTIETIHELGVENIVLVGMVGGFGYDINVRDVVIPSKILSEEGTSIHYVGNKKFAVIEKKDQKLNKYLSSKGHRVINNPTISTDAVYRQTFFKENYWRSLGCVGVDCEGSACVNVCKVLGIKCQCIFIVSDKHPFEGVDNNEWSWGLSYEDREKFISSLIDYYIGV